MGLDHHVYHLQRTQMTNQAVTEQILETLSVITNSDIISSDFIERKVAIHTKFILRSTKTNHLRLNHSKSSTFTGFSN